MCDDGSIFASLRKTPPSSIVRVTYVRVSYDLVAEDRAIEDLRTRMYGLVRHSTWQESSGTDLGLGPDAVASPFGKGLHAPRSATSQATKFPRYVLDLVFD